MEVTSTPIHKPNPQTHRLFSDEEPGRLSTTASSPISMSSSIINNDNTIKYSRSILSIPDSKYQTILKYTTRILESRILQWKPFLTDEEIYVVCISIIFQACIY
jgi:hypothetical protein